MLCLIACQRKIIALKSTTVEEDKHQAQFSHSLDRFHSKALLLSA